MYIATDETGSFREGKDLEYGIVTLVTITDKEWGKLKGLLDQLYPEGWSHIKGTNIEDEKREKIIKFIGKKHEIKYTSILYDLTFGTDEWVDYHKAGQVGKIKEAVESLKAQNGHKSLIEEIELMARRLNGMSNADYSKFILIYDIYREWLQFYQFDFLYIHKNNDTWDLNHIIDKQSRAGNFKTVLDEMLVLTTNNLNPEFRTYSPEELKDKDHPFELKHATLFEGRSAIDGRKVFKNVKISNEQDDPVLFLPDLIGNTIHRSIKFRGEKKWLKMLKQIKSNRSIIMNNKFRQGKNNYYLVRGFNPTLDRYQVNPIITEHWALMNGV